MVLQSNMFPHPKSPPRLALEMESGVRRVGDRLAVSYLILGDIDKITVPDQAGAARCNGLWKTTCFEAFVRKRADDSYLEYNFSPSGNWAAYCFDDYRANMRDLVSNRPDINVVSSSGHLQLSAEFDIPANYDGPLRIGLSTVIEEASGNLSYWALKHTTESPDFHRRNCFVWRIPAAGDA
jgi:hypothetical protein